MAFWKQMYRKIPHLALTVRDYLQHSVESLTEIFVTPIYRSGVIKDK
jgi:hypothetical protein